MKKQRILTIVVATFFLLSLALASVQAENYLSWEAYQNGEFEHALGVPGYTSEEKFDSYQEAPELEEMVEAGELPPASERLPDKPMVLPPNDEIGEYGGRFRTTAWGNDLQNTLMHRYFWEGLLSLDGKMRIVPNVAESYEYNDDKTALTFKLREGMRWSDGELYTAEDILFHYEDFMLYDPDPDRTPSVPANMADPVTGENPELIKVDDYTVRFEWDNPNPTFHYSFVAPPTPMFGTILPKHYLKQWHPRYTGAEGEEAAEQFEKIIDREETTRDLDPEMPSLAAWVLDRRIEGQRNIYKRNPYYRKVDPEGNQLPYMDEIATELVLDDDMKVLQATRGEFHVEFRGPQVDDLPLLHQRSEGGNYKPVILNNPDSQAEIVFNFYTEDENLRELFRTKEFRIAISHAINREQLNELGWEGLRQAGRSFLPPDNPASERFDIPEEWLNRYAEYDPEKANEILDDLGLEQGEDGIRRFPDGEKVSIVYEEYQEGVWAELFGEYFEDIGIELNVRMVDRTTWINSMSQNPPTYEMHFVTITGSPVGYFPETGCEMFQGGGWWGIPYEERDHPAFDPHPDQEKLFEMWNEVKGNPDIEERDQIIREAIDFYSENMVGGRIGLLRNRVEVGVVHNNLRNHHLDQAVFHGIFGLFGFTRPEHWYLVED